MKYSLLPESSDKNPIDLSVCIVTWKSKELLNNCLSSLKQGLADLNSEIFVIDNNSNDGSVELVQSLYPNIYLIINEKNVGVAPARNQILNIANGRYLVFLDVDTYIMPLSLKTLVDHMDQIQADIGGPKLVYGDGSLQLSCRPFPKLLNIVLEGTFLRQYFTKSRYVKDYTLEDWDHNALQEVDWMYGACLIIRQIVFRQLNGFDEGFFYLYEDIDLCFRAKNKGMKIIYIPQAKVVHYLERERKSIFHPMIFTHLRSIARYMYKKHLQTLFRKQI